MILFIVGNYLVSAQQDDNLLSFERACLFHIVKKSPSLNANFGQFFEYSGPNVLLNDGTINYDSIEQIITNRPDLLFIRKTEISKGPPGLLAELANKMAVLELNKVLLERRTNYVQNTPFINAHYTDFEKILTEELPPIAVVEKDSTLKPIKELYLFTDPALTFKQKVDYLSKNKNFTDEDRRKILNAFSTAINTHLQKRCFEIYQALGGIASDFESYLVAAGEGGNTAGLLAEFEKNLSGKWNKGLPKAIGLFPYQLERYNTKEISPERVATISMNTTGNNKVTNLHFDVWGYNSKKQTTIVIEKNNKNYILFGAGDTKFLSPDSTFSGGSTLISVVNDLEKNDVGKLKERISGKKGIEEKLKTKIEKRASVYKFIQEEEGKYMRFSNGKITVKKKAPRKVRRARKKALDSQSEQPNQSARPVIKSNKKKKRKKQVDLIDLYHQYETLTKEIQYFQQLKTEEIEKLSLYTDKLDFYKSALGENILGYSIKDSLYTFSDSSTFDMRTQEFQFYPTQKPEPFFIKLIAIPDNAIASSADEVMLHVSKIDQDPRLTATLNLNLSDQFDPDKYELKQSLILNKDSVALRTISEIILKSEKPIVIKANGYGVGEWNGFTVVKNPTPKEMNTYPTSRTDSTYARLRKTAMYIQTNYKLVIEIESFTDPVYSGISINNKVLAEIATKNKLSKNDILSGLRTKTVMLTFQDEYIKWVAQHYDASKARIIIDRFNNELQKTRIRVGEINFKPKELTLE
ncbi:MAG: hypothetical protein ACKO7D_01010 [Bacteroidota bacterium]